MGKPKKITDPQKMGFKTTLSSIFEKSQKRVAGEEQDFQTGQTKAKTDFEKEQNTLAKQALKAQTDFTSQPDLSLIPESIVSEVDEKGDATDVALGTIRNIFLAQGIPPEKLTTSKVDELFAQFKQGLAIRGPETIDVPGSGIFGTSYFAEQEPNPNRKSLQELFPRPQAPASFEAKTFTPEEKPTIEGISFDEENKIVDVVNSVSNQVLKQIGGVKGLSDPKKAAFFKAQVHSLLGANSDKAIFLVKERNKRAKEAGAARELTPPPGMTADEPTAPQIDLGGMSDDELLQQLGI